MALRKPLGTAPSSTSYPSESKEEKAISFYADALQAATEAHINAPTSSKNGKKRAELLQAALRAATTPEEVNAVITQRLQRTISRPFQKKRNQLGPHSLDTRILNQLCGDKIGPDNLPRKTLRDDIIYMLLPIDYSEIFKLTSPKIYWRWGFYASGSILDETLARLFMEKADKSDAQKFAAYLLDNSSSIIINGHLPIFLHLNIPAILQLIPILSPTQKTDITQNIMKALKGRHPSFLGEKEFDQLYELLTLIAPEKINLLLQELLRMPLEDQSCEDSLLAFHLAHRLKQNEEIARTRFLNVIGMPRDRYNDFYNDFVSRPSARDQFLKKLNLSQDEMTALPSRLTSVLKSKPTPPDDKKHESKTSPSKEDSTDLFQMARNLIKIPQDDEALELLLTKPLHVQNEFLYYLRLAKDECLIQPLRENNFDYATSRIDHKLQAYLAYERIRHYLITPRIIQSNLLVHSIFSLKQAPLNLVLDYLDMPRCKPGF